MITSCLTQTFSRSSMQSGMQRLCQMVGLLKGGCTYFTSPNRSRSHTTLFKPINRLNPAESVEVQRQVTEALRRRITEPILSPHGATVLFVRKKDGSLNKCVDYWALNKLNTKIKYPLPCIDDLLDQLHGTWVLSLLHLQGGYHMPSRYLATSGTPVFYYYF